MNDRFGLQLQTLQKVSHRVLVLGDLVASKSDDKQFTASELHDAFMALHVPPPGNISQVLADLRKNKWTLSYGKGRWSLTPLGRQRVIEIVGERSENLLVVPSEMPTAEFAHVQQTVIPPWAAPPKWQVGIKRLLDDYPFESNVFCMTRFPSEGGPPDPVKAAIEVLRTVMSEAGLHLHLASDRLIDDDLLGNVGAYMWACQYGIGIIENTKKKGVNYNAVIELGGMIVTGRRCAILKDKRVPALPTDLAGQIYKTIDLEDMSTVESESRRWIRDDLGIKL